MFSNSVPYQHNAHQLQNQLHQSRLVCMTARNVMLPKPTVFVAGSTSSVTASQSERQSSSCGLHICSSNHANPTRCVCPSATLGNPCTNLYPSLPNLPSRHCGAAATAAAAGGFGGNRPTGTMSPDLVYNSKLHLYKSLTFDEPGMRSAAQYL